MSETNELRIAVIGAGPAGVYSSDIFLRQLGKLGEELGLGTKARIDLFEKLPVPFGLVRYGVAPDHPSIKFIASALEKTLDNPDIHLYCDVEFGKDVTLDELLERYDAVLFATGAVEDKPLGLPGADLDGVYGAAKFVEWYDGYPTGAREWPLEAEEVAVIGGGNVAMDVARSAVRCGAEKVSIVYRRRICDMTAQDAEIAGAQAEGCEVLELTAPLAIETGEDGRVSGLRVQPQIIGEPRRGRPAPRAAATPERVIPCERVFVAIGQDIDSKPFEEMGIACKWGCVVTDSDGAVPNFDGLFSGGDCQTGPATVIRAINAGRVASANIDRYLGFDHKIKLDVELPTVQFKGKHECGRCELGEREAGERIHDWNLVEQGLTEQEARQEASRCLRCDHFGFGAFRGGRNLEW